MSLRTDKEIIVNGKKLTDEQATMVIEAINGHYEFGVQCDGYLEGECGIGLEAQREIVEGLFDILVM